MDLSTFINNIESGIHYLDVIQRFNQEDNTIIYLCRLNTMTIDEFYTMIVNTYFDMDDIITFLSENYELNFDNYTKNQYTQFINTLNKVNIDYSLNKEEYFSFTFVNSTTLEIDDIKYTFSTNEKLYTFIKNVNKERRKQWEKIKLELINKITPKQKYKYNINKRINEWLTDQ